MADFDCKLEFEPEVHRAPPLKINLIPYFDTFWPGNIDDEFISLFNHEFKPLPKY